MYRTAHSSSKVSKDGDLSTPFAPRPFRARPAVSTDYPAALRRNMTPRQEYYSLSDPHLEHYFRAKLPSSLKRRRSRAFSSLSFRTEDSDLSTRSHGSLNSHRPTQFTYKVTVRTGTADDAGTNSRAYITLQGSKGTLKRRRLAKSSRGEFIFHPGTSAVFKVRGKDVGDLTHVTIESEGLKKADPWYVTSVSVVNEEGKKWLCPCNQWLSLYHTDCQLARTLRARPQAVGATPLSPTLYTMEVHTGDVRGAGTTANVFVTIEGSTNCSSKQHLRGGENGGFDRASVVKREMECPADLGQVKRVVIGHDNDGFGADWFLDQVVLYPHADPQDKLFFMCGQWLSRTQGDGLIQRTLSTSSPPTIQLPRKTYTVAMVTGGMRGAGTDANVFITLFGGKGTSGERCLDNAPANFERGRTDIFSVCCGELGTLNKVLVRHDNSGVGPSWYLDQVEVTETGSGRGGVRFPCGRWLEECEGCGGKLEVELSPEGSPDQHNKSGVNATHMYQVEVVTSRRAGAGTSAGVYVVMCGRDEATDKLWLDNGRRSLLAGQTDMFEVRTQTLVSPVESLTTGHDNSGPSPGWFLEEVRVKCCTTGDRWTFPCLQWLCSDTGDGRIARELHPLLPNEAHSGHSLPWKVRVFTSDLRGAGTDANVTLQVHGEQGSSDPIPLGGNIADFERGECDVFQGVLVPTRVGTIQGVTVSHDGTNPYPEWHLEKVELSNASLQLKFHCHCGRWLCSDNGNSVRLTAVSAHEDSKPTLANVSPLQPLTNGHLSPLTNGHLSPPQPLTNGHELSPPQPLTNGHELSPLQPLTNGHELSPPQPLTNDRLSPPLSQPLTNGHLSPSSPANPKSIPYTVHIVGGVPPLSSHAPFLELVLCGEGGSSLPITLEPLGTRPAPGTPETYSVEGANIGDITHIKLKLVGSAGVSWLISEVTIHSPTSGHTHHFPWGRGLVAGEEESVVKAVEVLESSYNTSTMVSTPRASSTLIAYEVKVFTADKKAAGTCNSLYLMVVGEQLSSKVFVFKNSTRNPLLQRGQTDSFQVATPPLGALKAVKVAHCPRKKHRNAESALPEGERWFLFQIVLTNMLDKTKASFLCRQWVESSPSPQQLNYTEISLST